jgi:hypothetical protein
MLRLFQTKQHGYSFIQLALVLTVTGLLSSGGMTIWMNKNARSAMNTTLDRMKIVEEALTLHLTLSEHLPCPALSNINDRDQAYLTSAAYDTNSKECGTDQSGLVPVRSLNLDNKFSYDGWGRKFSYKIAKNMGNIVDFKNHNGTIKISNLSGEEITNSATYVLISWGENGTSQIINYIQNSKTKAFDDILRFKNKNNFAIARSDTEALSPIRIPKITCDNASALMKLTTDRIIQVAAVNVNILCQRQAQAKCKINPLSVGEPILWLDANDPRGDGIAPKNKEFIEKWVNKAGPKYSAMIVDPGRNTILSNNTPFKPKVAFEFKKNAASSGGYRSPLPDFTKSAYSIFKLMAVANNIGSFLDKSIFDIGYKNNNDLAQHDFISNSYYMGNLPYDSNLAGISSPALNAFNNTPILIIGKYDPAMGYSIFGRTQEGQTSQEVNDVKEPISYDVNNDLMFGGNFTGYGAELIIYPKALNQAEQAAVEGYLVRKWFTGECP